MDANEKRIKALEKRVQELQADVGHFTKLLKKERTRADRAEAQIPAEPQHTPLSLIPGYDEGVSYNGRYSKSIRAAFERGKTWTLTPQEYADLSESPCHYCQGPTGGGIGLDRIDNRRGYEPSNVLPCCGRCNGVRGRHLSVNETLLAVGAILVG